MSIVPFAGTDAAKLVDRLSPAFALMLEPPRYRSLKLIADEPPTNSVRKSL